MQTSYSLNQAAGMVGMIADTTMVQDIETYKNPAAEVKFGCVVTRGAASDEIVHPDAEGEVTGEKVVRGIVVAAHEVESVNDGERPGYAAKSVVPVMRKGRIWVISEDAITEGTSGVFVRHAANGGDTQLGNLRGATGTGATGVLPKSKWKSSTSGTYELAVLEIDL